MTTHPHHDTAAAIMTPDPVCAEPSTTIRQLARLLDDNDISGCPVIDHAGRVVGVVSKTDLIRRCSEGAGDIPPAYLFEVITARGPADETGPASPIPEPLVCVQDFMTPGAVTARPTTPIHEVAALMTTRGVHRVIVVDDDMYPLGMITALDVLKRFPRHGS